MSDDVADKGAAEIRRGREAIDQQRAADARREAELRASEFRAQVEGRGRAPRTAEQPSALVESKPGAAHRRRVWPVVVVVTVVVAAVVVALVVRP